MRGPPEGPPPGGFSRRCLPVFCFVWPAAVWLAGGSAAVGISAAGLAPASRLRRLPGPSFVAGPLPCVPVHPLGGCAGSRAPAALRDLVYTTKGASGACACVVVAVSVRVARPTSLPPLVVSAPSSRAWLPRSTAPKYPPTPVPSVTSSLPCTAAPALPPRCLAAVIVPRPGPGLSVSAGLPLRSSALAVASPGPPALCLGRRCFASYALAVSSAL